MKHQQNGYILFITFAMLALCATITSLFFVRGMGHRYLVQVVSQQDRLQTLAQSAVEIAKSQLLVDPEELAQAQQEELAQKAEKAQMKDGDSGYQRLLLEKILPYMNRVQTYNLQYDVDGITAKVAYRLGSESGKININGLYDFVEGRFYNEGAAEYDMQKFTQKLFETIAKVTEQQSLYKPFVEHLKTRNTAFNDVTELLQIPEFAQQFKDRVFPPLQLKKLEHAQEEKKDTTLYLLDLFTIVSEDATLDPWLLSPSICVLLGIPFEEMQDGKKEKSKEENMLQHFKVQPQWDVDWDLAVQPLYHVAYADLPDFIKPVLTQQVNPHIFSIMLRVTVGHLSATVYALVKSRRLHTKSLWYDVIKVYQL